MKRKILYILCLMLWITGCDENISNPYNCMWRNDRNAVFMNSKLSLPCSECEENFKFGNSLLETCLLPGSLYMIMESLSFNKVGSNFSFKWNIALTSNKPCYDLSSSTNSISFSKDNYTSYMFSQDVLVGTLYVDEREGFTPYDHKHEMVFQIFNVDNMTDGTMGTITWKQTFETLVPITPNEWQFTFPNNGVEGKFYPNANYVSKIYINGHYENRQF